MRKKGRSGVLCKKELLPDREKRWNPLLTVKKRVKMKKERFVEKMSHSFEPFGRIRRKNE